MATIYSITSMKGNKVYIGSTTMSLARRKAAHKRDNRCTSVLLKEEYGWDNLIFTALEECSVEQQFERERFHIENTENTINKVLPGRTEEELKEAIYSNDKKYRVKNREAINERMKKYNKENKDKIDRKNKERYEVHKDEIDRKSKEYYKANIEEIHRKNKERYEAHKDEINQKRREAYKAKKQSNLL
jgi:hypothetical protein